MNQYRQFLQLHERSTPLLIGNVWDVSSAKVFEANGFEALATSSSAIAYSLGYEDGEQMPFELLLQIVKRIINNISIPLSVDMEAGYGNDVSQIIQNLERLYELGAVGFNIEDSIPGKNEIQSIDHFKQIVFSINNHFQKNNIGMFCNVRTDAYLLKLSSPLNETLKRIKAYEDAGASGIFVPFITEKDDIRQVVQATKLPIHVLCAKDLPGFKMLAELGVKRISTGGAIYKFMLRSLQNTIQTIQRDQSFKHLF